MRENRIEQDLAKNVIYLDERQITLQPTDRVAILPTKPLVSAIQVPENNPSKNITFQRKTLLLGQCYQFPLKQEEGTVLVIEPHERNNYAKWPEP